MALTVWVGYGLRWMTAALLFCCLLPSGVLAVTGDPRADVNEDGRVNSIDLLILMDNWQLDVYTPTDTPTLTDTGTITDTPTDTLTFTITDTFSDTGTSTDTFTITNTPTDTLTYTNTDTSTQTATRTHTPIPPPTRTWTVVHQTITPTMSGTATRSPTDSATPANSATPSWTITPIPTGVVWGYVSDIDTGDRLASVPISLEFFITPAVPTRVAYSETNGDYIFENVPTGSYGLLTATRQGYFSYTYGELFITENTNHIIRMKRKLELTATPTMTYTPTQTRTWTPTHTPSNTFSATPTKTPINTATPTITPTNTRTNTPAFSWTPTQTRTATPAPVNMVGTWRGNGEANGIPRNSMTVTFHDATSATVSWYGKTWTDCIYQALVRPGAWDFHLEKAGTFDDPKIALDGEFDASRNQLTGDLYFKQEPNPWQAGSFSLDRQ